MVGRRSGPAAPEPRCVLPGAPDHPAHWPRHPADLLGSFRLPGDCAWGTGLDFGCFLQRSSTSAPRMGHVCIRDSLLLFLSLPGLVPLWYGDSDWRQLELPGLCLSFCRVCLLLWSLFTRSSGYLPAWPAVQHNHDGAAAPEWQPVQHQRGSHSFYLYDDSLLWLQFGSGFAKMATVTLLGNRQLCANFTCPLYLSGHLGTICPSVAFQASFTLYRENLS